MPKRKIEENGDERPVKSKKDIEEEDENEDALSENDSKSEGLLDSEEDSLNDEQFDDEDECDDEDQELDDEVQIEFCAFNPEKDDYDGIKQLLDRLWLKESVNTGKIADFIIEKQQKFATLLRQVDDNAPEVPAKKENNNEVEDEELEEDDFDQVYSLSTVIPFNEHFKKESPELIDDLKNWLLKKLPADHPIREKINTKVPAYLISERFINIPIKASIPCYEGLLKDIEADKNYKFDHVIMQIKLVKDKKTKKDVIYTNAEEELFDEQADGSFEYSVADQCDSDVYDWNDDEKLYEPYRKIVLISKQKWINVIKSLPKECQ